MKTRILFVCLGNICRSPAAEGIFRHKVDVSGLSDRLEIDSAGTYGGHNGSLPDPRMRVAASGRGYDLIHRSRQIKSVDFDRFDLIIVMDDSNYERVSHLAPSVEALGKIHRMTDYCTIHTTADHVPDPYYEGSQGFELVLDLLEDACGGLLRNITSKASKL